VSYKLLPLKRVLDRNDGGVWGDDPTGFGDTVVLRSTEQTVDGEWAMTEPAMRSLQPAERTKAQLHDGDLLVTKSSGSALHIGKTTLVTPEIAALSPSFSNFMQRLRVAPSHDPRFYWYCLRSSMVRDQLKLFSTTTTGLANLNASNISNLEVPTPSGARQRQIVDYLDAQTAKIDTLIGKQEQLIETLAERRQAVISHAVTKGLDPNAPMKDSGVEWLGAIPESWDLTRIRYIARILGGYSPEQAIPEGDGDFPYFRVSDLNATEGEFLVSSAAERVSVKEMTAPAGTVLFPKRGGAIFTNKVAVSGIQGAFDTNLMGLRVDENRVEAVFLAHWLKSRTLTELADTSTLPQINNKHIYPLQIGLPGLSEQRQILARLSLTTTKIDTLAAKSREMIEVLKERRQALISAAVTGKIDVRGLV
jgi:type I restriction enzyme S subunit